MGIKRSIIDWMLPRVEKIIKWLENKREERKKKWEEENRKEGDE